MAHFTTSVLLLLASAMPGQSDRAAARPITDTVPADCLIVFTAKPYSELSSTTASSQPAPGVSIGTILSLLSTSGLLPDEGQVFADIAAALPLLGRYEHALALLDVSSKVVQRPGRTTDAPPQVSLRLRHMQAAIIFRTEKDDRAVLQQINRIVGRYTNNQVAELTSEKSCGLEFQRLADDRMPGWAIWEWGRLGDFYALSFGRGSFEKLARSYSKEAPALTDDSWFGPAMKRTRGDEALAKWFIALDRIEEQFKEIAKGRHEKVVAALGADNLSHDLWTIGLDGRALSCYRLYRRNGEDVLHKYSDPATFPKKHARIVPKDARRYAVINVPTSWLVDNVPRGWVAAQSEQHIQDWTRIWESLEQEVGIDLSSNLINNLANHIVIFDYPPHPLDIPLAYSMAIEVKDQKAVKAAIDAILTAWGQYLDDRAKRSSSSLVRVRVCHAEDDVWFLQAGILGPALKVIPGYVVISWSPQALRDVLKAIDP